MVLMNTMMMHSYMNKLWKKNESILSTSLHFNKWNAQMNERINNEKKNSFSFSVHISILNHMIIIVCMKREREREREFCIKSEVVFYSIFKIILNSKNMLKETLREWTNIFLSVGLNIFFPLSSSPSSIHPS